MTNVKIWIVKIKNIALVNLNHVPTAEIRCTYTIFWISSHMCFIAFLLFLVGLLKTKIIIRFFQIMRLVIIL